LIGDIKVRRLVGVLGDSKSEFTDLSCTRRLGDSKSEFTDLSFTRRARTNMESSCDDLSRDDRFEAPALALEIEVYVEREVDCRSIVGSLLPSLRKWSDRVSRPLRRPGADAGVLVARRLTEGASSSRGGDRPWSPILLFARFIVRGEILGLEVGFPEIDLFSWGATRDFELCGRSPRLTDGACSSRGGDRPWSSILLFARFIVRGEILGLEVGFPEIDLFSWGARDFELCGLSPRLTDGACSSRGGDRPWSSILLFARFIVRGEILGLEVGFPEIDLFSWGARDFELCGRSPRLLGGFFIGEVSA
jgi:hypothetical protein